MKESLSLFDASFVTLRVSLSERSAHHYLKESVAAQVPMEILTRHLLHQKTLGRETGNMIDPHLSGQSDKRLKRLGHSHELVPLDALEPAEILRRLQIGMA